jgi:hypothetical protein
MIGHFPTPLPDELFYSLCARYSRRARYPNHKAVLLDLFDSSTALAVIDLPTRLKSFIRSLVPNSLLTADRLIKEHTLLPLFSAFLPPARLKQIRADMIDSKGPAAHMRTGSMASTVPSTEFLRFCPCCRQHDITNFGEAYWHRLHQVPGVLMCPIHDVFLENGPVSLRANRNCIERNASAQRSSCRSEPPSSFECRT